MYFITTFRTLTFRQIVILYSYRIYICNDTFPQVLSLSSNCHRTILMKSNTVQTCHIKCSLNLHLKICTTNCEQTVTSTVRIHFCQITSLSGCDQSAGSWLRPLAPPVGTVGETTKKQRDMELIRWVAYSEDNLDIWIKAILAETPPVLSCVKVQFVHTRGKHFPGDETRATSVSIRYPSGNQIPDSGWRVLFIKQDGHVGPRDPHSSVQHMRSQWTARSCHCSTRVRSQHMTR